MSHFYETIFMWLFHLPVKHNAICTVLFGVELALIERIKNNRVSHREKHQRELSRQIVRIYLQYTKMEFCN